MNTYRHDIDGLRALAVLSVVFYHLNPRLAPGGFVGVDVFFVISGYLITHIVWDQIRRQNFSILSFYKRRAARLFPALFLMLLCCGIATYFISHPNETRFFGKSLIASTFYVSNIFYLSETSYFSVDPRLNPLLHTWSLSVEEQFYLLYPLLLICIFKYCKNKLALILLLIASSSFLLSIILTNTTESAAFFLAPSRFYQLLIGAILAIVLLKPNSIFSELSVALGLVTVVATVVLLSEQSTYPGINALIPTLGAALILLGGNNSIVSTIILSNMVSRQIGKMSYSIYLWHWPIIVFYKIALNPTPKRQDQIVLFAVILIVSYFSWRFIETPFRHKGLVLTKKEIFNKTVLASMIGLIVGCIFIIPDGLQYRFPKERLYFAQYKEESHPSNLRDGTCFLNSSSKPKNGFTEDKCIKYETGKKNILLLGDSHINRLYYPARDTLTNSSISQITSSGCRPTVSKNGSEYCLRLMRDAFETFIPHYQFDIVILFGYWKDHDVNYLHDTVELISRYARQVVVLGPIVTYEQALPRLLARFTTNGVESSIFKNARNYRERLRVDHMMKNKLADSNADYISLMDLICPLAVCKTTTTKGEPLQIDYGHLSYAGGVDVMGLIIDSDILKLK